MTILGLHTSEAGVASIAWGESSNPRYNKPRFKPVERAAEIFVRPLAWALALFIRYLGFENSPQAMLEPPPSEVVKAKGRGGRL